MGGSDYIRERWNALLNRPRFLFALEPGIDWHFYW